MARYDYKCPQCETVFEVEHPMTEKPTIVCPQCGTVAQRVFSATGIHFEGHGFYNTDRRKFMGTVGSASDTKES